MKQLVKLFIVKKELLLKQAFKFYKILFDDNLFVDIKLSRFGTQYIYTFV